MRGFSQLTGVLAVAPLSYHRYVYQYADGGERRGASEPVSCADLGGYTAIPRCQACHSRMFNPWTIKWTSYTHGLTSSGTLQTVVCSPLLRPASILSRLLLTSLPLAARSMS